jgi:hypothetical protein
LLVLGASLALVTSVAGTSAAFAPAADGGVGSAASDVGYYINYVAPQIDRQTDGEEVPGAGGVMQPPTVCGSPLDQAWRSTGIRNQQPA